MTTRYESGIDLAQRFWGIPGTELALTHTLFIDEDLNRITVRRFLDEVEQLSDELEDAGVGDGDLIVCAVQTSLRWISTLSALWSIGAVPIISRATSPAPMLEITARRIGARYLLSSTPRGLDVQAIAVEEPHAEIGQGSDRLLLGLLTSGSTGEPKVVGHRRRGLVSFAESIELYGAGPTSTIVTSADISFGYGLTNIVLIPLMTGATGLLWSDPNRTDALLAAVERESVTIAAFSPRVWAGIARRMRQAGPMLNSVVTPLSAGEPLPDELRAVLEQNLRTPIIDGFGATEVLRLVAVRRSASSGLEPLPGVELNTAIVAGQRVLTIAGEMSSATYLYAAEQDRHALADGRFTTGDAVAVEGERLNYIGRADFLINRGGVLFSPVELEALVREVLDIESVAAEVPHSHGASSKLVLGLMNPSSEQSPVQLGRQLRQRLADTARTHLIPELVTTVPTLPVTPTGKLDRRAAAGMLARRIGSTLRWRDTSSGRAPGLVVLPCAGAGADFYGGLVAAANCRTSVIEVDITAVTEIDAVIDGIADNLAAETAPGDRIVGHSLGVTLLAAVAARRPEVLRDRITVAFCPPPPDPSTGELTALALETEQLLATIFAGQTAALSRARRRTNSEMSSATQWLTQLGRYLRTFTATAEVVVADDPFARDLQPVTACSHQIRLPTGGHYLPVTAPDRVMAIVEELRGAETGKANALSER